MRVERVLVDLPVPDVEEAVDFYTGLLDLDREDLGPDWVTRLLGDRPGVRLQLVSHDATAPENAIVSIGVDDVDAAYARAIERGDEIVHPLTTEEWGVRRFFVRDPGGNVINVLRHRD